MKKKITSVTIALALLFLFWIFFSQKPTMFALPVGCMPKTVEDIRQFEKQQPAYLKIYKKIFGTKCVTW